MAYARRKFAASPALVDQDQPWRAPIRNRTINTANKRRNTEAALRAAFNTPPKPQSEMKLGKPKASQKYLKFQLHSRRP